MEFKSLEGQSRRSEPRFFFESFAEFLGIVALDVPRSTLASTPIKVSVMSPARAPSTARVSVPRG